MFPQFSFLVFVRSLSNEQLKLVDHLWKCQGLSLKLWCLLLAAEIWTVQLKREQLLPSVSPFSPGSHHTEHLEGNNLHFIYVQSHCSVRCKTSPSQGGLCLAVLSWEAWTMSVLVASSTLLTTGSKAPGGAFPNPCFLSLSRKIHTLPPDKKAFKMRGRLQK